MELHGLPCSVLFLSLRPLRIAVVLVGASSRVNLTLHALSTRTSRPRVSFSVKSGCPILISDADVERELHIRWIRGKMRNTSMEALKFEASERIIRISLNSIFCS